MKWYVGDCREVLKTIPDRSVDFVVTSPPYNIGKDYGIYKDNLSHEEYINFIFDVVKECKRVIVDDGRIAINIPKTIKYKDSQKIFLLYDYLNIIVRLGFNIREIIDWFKSTNDIHTSNHISGGSCAWGSWKSASNPHMRGQMEVIIVANKDSWKKESGSRISDISDDEFKLYTNCAWFIPCSHVDHPAPFPIDIPLRLIKLYTFVGDTILDPFVGSGTTLEACDISGRNGIGIDINPEYKNCINNRLILKEINKNSYEVKRRKSLFEE